MEFLVLLPTLAYNTGIQGLTKSDTDWFLKVGQGAASSTYSGKGRAGKEMGKGNTSIICSLSDLAAARMIK